MNRKKELQVSEVSGRKILEQYTQRNYFWSVGVAMVGGFAGFCLYADYLELQKPAPRSDFLIQSVLVVAAMSVLAYFIVESRHTLRIECFDDQFFVRTHRGREYMVPYCDVVSIARPKVGGTADGSQFVNVKTTATKFMIEACPDSLPVLDLLSEKSGVPIERLSRKN